MGNKSNIKKDPGETEDLAQAAPKLFAEMIQHYAVYTEEMGVLEMGTQYEAQAELTNKIREIVLNAVRPWVMGLFVCLFGEGGDGD